LGSEHLRVDNTTLLQLVVVILAGWLRRASTKMLDIARALRGRLPGVVGARGAELRDWGTGS